MDKSKLEKALEFDEHWGWILVVYDLVDDKHKDPCWGCFSFNNPSKKKEVLKILDEVV